MQNRRTKLIFIYRTKLLTRFKLRQILNQDPSLNSLFILSPSEISHRYKIPMDKAVKLKQKLQDNSFQNVIHEDAKMMSVITLFDKNYPLPLKNIPDPPLVLYAVGNLDFLNYSPSISVIGTRQPSPFGGIKLRKIVEPLIKEKWAIVSGLAQGIDGIAHQLALSHDSPTIAVLGGGFSHVYPKIHYSMFKEIMKKGLVISEYAHDEKPQRYHFPERNRIISGLTEATLVIEAMKRSGTFITIDQALEQGKDVYAVPDSPLNPKAEGCNVLIQEGAKLVQTAEDIMEDFNINKANKRILESQ